MIKSCYYCRRSHAMLSLIKHIFLLDYGHLAMLASRSNAKELRIAVSFQIDKVRLAMLSRRESGGSRARAPVKESMTCAGATNVFAAAHCAERNPLRPPRHPAPQPAPPRAARTQHMERAHPPGATLIYCTIVTLSGNKCLVPGPKYLKVHNVEDVITFLIRQS